MNKFKNPYAEMPILPIAVQSEPEKHFEKRLRRIQTGKAINILLLGETGVGKRYSFIP
jgi:hypothetical protein